MSPTVSEGKSRQYRLPDWALIDLDQAPDALAAGKVIAAGFFDEEWKLK